MTIWSFGGTLLSSFGKVTLINDNFDMPERRGENVVLPFRHGKLFIPKYYDERRMIFGLGIEATSAAALESTIDTLRALLSTSTPQTLSQIRADGTIRTASATVDAPLQVERFGPKVVKCVLEFTLPFPFFRLSTAIADNETTINASPKAMVVTNPGTVEERDPTIILTGPLQNTVITNSTNGCVLTYTGTIASPRVVTIQTVDGEYVATDDLGANKISNLSHSGASALMIIDKGTNNLSITDATATTGKVKVTFNAPFL